MGYVESKTRIQSIDVVRGIAMFFVFWSHFGEIYFGYNKAYRLLFFSRSIGMIASPTFMIISGVVLGYLYSLKKSNFSSIKTKFIDRGIFLLFFGHFIIAIAHIPLSGSFRSALGWGFITDTIGINLIIGTLLIDRISSRCRLIIALIGYGLSWIVILFRHPHTYFQEVVGDYLFGRNPGLNVFPDNFPVLPWFCIYFASTYLGEKIGESKKSNKLNLFLPRISLISLAFLCTVMIIKISIEEFYHLTHIFRYDFIDSLLNPLQKLPPGPLYIFFYGGIGLEILYRFFILENKYSTSIFFKILSIIGQNSLFLFIIQYFVYYSGFHLLKLKFSFYWPLYFLLSMISILFISYIWHKKDFNRFISISFYWKSMKALIRNSILRINF